MSAAVIPAIIALTAIIAVAAGFLRRGVVVDIINWPVSLSLSYSGSLRGLGTEAPNLIGVIRLYKLSPSLQTALSPTQ